MAKDTRWVFVSAGPLAAAAADNVRSVPGATYCVAPLGWKSPLIERLKLRQLPYVYVIDANQELFGFGRPIDLPALLTRPISDHSSP